MGSRNQLSKDDSRIEMTDMTLSQETQDESSFFREESSRGWTADYDDDSELIERVEWKGQIITTYPLDYQKVSIVKWQIICFLIMFAVFGLNDQAVGTLIPTLTENYRISKVTVSILFLIQVFGYTVASLFNEKLHQMGGTRGAILLAGGFCIGSYAILLFRPASFVIYAICYLPLGFSIGILDSTGNVFIGNLLVHKNEWMGILHGLYGAAAMATPPIVSYFVKINRWSTFYLLPLCLAVIGTLMTPIVFRHETSAKYRFSCSEHQGELSLDDQEEEGDNVNPSPGFTGLLKIPAIILYASYLFLYLGAELSTGSWLFSYLLATKSSDRIRMSWVTSSYWTGLTVGRMCLGFVTKRLFRNEYRASRIYGLLTLLSYTLFVIVGWHDSGKPLYLAVLFLIIFLSGVFIGPLFPNASIVALQVLPKNLHIGGVGLSVALGGCGNALLPYLVGVALHYLSMSWLPFLCWTIVIGFNIIWALYPKFIKGHEEFL